MFRGTQVPPDSATTSSCKGLSPALAGVSIPFHYRSCVNTIGGPTTPRGAVTPAVWALARSLATTCAIIVIFSSYGYLDVSVPRVRSTSFDAVTESLPPGFPIRTSADHGAFASPRSFSQLITSFVASESHRHPPCALSCFLISFAFLKPFL